jgi:hypothetical protein
MQPIARLPLGEYIEIGVKWMTNNLAGFFTIYFNSSSVSVGKRLIATTAGSPNTLVIFSTCFNRLPIPCSNAGMFSLQISDFCIPP